MTVPDITVANAYLEAIKGVDYAIHIASPIESSRRLKKDQFDEHLIQPAVRATLNILEAAKSETRVKRMVITSSVYATVPYEYLSRRDMAEGESYAAAHRLSFDEGPYEDESQAYTILSCVDKEHSVSSILQGYWCLTINAIENWCTISVAHHEAHPSSD